MKPQYSDYEQVVQDKMLEYVAKAVEAGVKRPTRVELSEMQSLARTAAEYADSQRYQLKPLPVEEGGRLDFVSRQAHYTIYSLLTCGQLHGRPVGWWKKWLDLSPQ